MSRSELRDGSKYTKKLSRRKPVKSISRNAQLNRARKRLKYTGCSKDDRSSVDEDRPGQRDSLSSSPEPEGSTMDSETSITSATDKRGESATPFHLDSYNRIGQGNDQGKNARPFPAA